MFGSCALAGDGVGIGDAKTSAEAIDNAAGEVEGAGETKESSELEGTAVSGSLKAIVLLTERDPRSHRKPANAAAATTITSNTRKRADVVARSLMAIFAGPGVTADAVLFLQKTSSHQPVDDDARSVAAKCKAQSGPDARAVPQTPFRPRVQRRALFPD